MARIAMLSDIHSNWVALQAVLREVAVNGVDRVVCLGDLVGYGLAMMAHANLEQPMGFDYIESLEDATSSLGILRAKKMAVGFFGHTHQQEVFCEGEMEWLDETRFRVSVEQPCVVMVGSVGQSRVEGDLRAAWAIWDEGEGVVELRKTEYDRMAAARAIVEAGLPVESAERLLTDAEYEILKADK